MVKKLVIPYRIKFSQESRERIFELMQAPFDSGMVGDHTLCRTLEKNVLSLYPHFKYAVTVSDCTTALEIVYKYLARFRGIESVDVQDHTFISDFWAAENAGLDVRLVDVSKEDFLPQVEKDTEALLVAPIGGVVSKRINPLFFDCAKRGIPFIVDAAHALGTAPLRNDDIPMQATLQADFVTFSFGRIKPATGGTGGMILTRNSKFVDYARAMVEWGKRGHKNYYHGVSGLMSEWNAAVAIERLERLPQEIMYRESIASVYDDVLKKFSDRIRYGTYTARGDSYTNFYRYYIMAEFGWNIDYAGIMIEMLNEYGIHLPARVYQYGIHEQDDLKERYESYSDKEFPNTMHITKNHICLPCYMDMESGGTLDVAYYVAEAIQKTLPKFLRKV